MHSKSDMYDMEAFKNGKSSLIKYELEALGDVKGKSLLHLQCHFGQDTLSWNRLGASCVGVDISDECPYNILPDLVETKSRMYTLKNKLYPLIFTIKATKP